MVVQNSEAAINTDMSSAKECIFVVQFSYEWESLQCSSVAIAIAVAVNTYVKAHTHIGF